MPPPTKAELDQLLKTLTSRIGRHLERHGWLTRDVESSHLNLAREDAALDSLLGHSITYRIALGPRAGQKAFTLQSLPGRLLLRGATVRAEKCIRSTTILSRWLHERGGGLDARHFRYLS